ncbi:MAG: threonine/serine exporter family protein, partial [Trichococcus flocculiformis]
QEAYDALQNIDEIQYSGRQKSFALIGFIQLFIFLMGGTFYDFLAMLPVSATVSFVLHTAVKWKIRPFIQNLVSSFVIAVMTAILSELLTFPIQPDTIIISAIMPLLPGTVLTNGIRDTFRGDYMSGAAKILEAFVIAIFIAIGIGAGLVVGGEVIR